MPNPRNQLAKKHRKQLIQAWGAQCMWDGCEKTSKLHFAHLKPTPISQISRGRGRKERYYDIIKHPMCYCLLCDEHHQEFDRLRRLGDMDNSIIDALFQRSLHRFSILT